MNANITRWIQHHLHRLEQNLNRTDPSDGSVYTGYAGMKQTILLSVVTSNAFLGIALLYLRLATFFPDQRSQHISRAKSLIDLALRQLDGKRNCLIHASLDSSFS